MPAEKTEFKVFHALAGGICELLSDIYGLAMEKTSGDHSNLRRKLEQMAREMDAMVQEHIKNTVQSMTKNAESQCPHIFEGIRDDLDEKSKERSCLPSSFVKDHVIKQTGTEIINKVSEMNLTVATLISDKVTDTLLAALSQCNSTLTEQLKRKKEEQALARQQEFIDKANERKEAEKNEATTEKPEPNIPSSHTDSSADEVDKRTDQEEDHKEHEGKPPSITDTILPAMRKERAASVARRKQRPNSAAALDLEYKKKPEDQPTATPPRSSSPIVETEIVTPAPAEPHEADKDEKDEVTEEKDKEPVYSTVNKKQKVEEQEEEIKEEKEEETEEKSEEMVKEEESKEENREDETDEPKIDFDLPELPTSTKKLEHVTKGRPRPAKRGAPRKPTKPTVDTDEGLDEFFTASVESTDFDKVPTLTEEKELAEKENAKKTPKRPTGGIGMMGMPKLTPEMLKKKKKPVDSDHEDKDDSAKKSEEKADEKNGQEEDEKEQEEPKTPEPVVKRRPPGAMGLPGMGFGSNILGEMKLKKLNKSKSPEPANHDKAEETKNGTHQPLPFGPGMLKKRPPVADKPETNNNTNENNNILRSPPNRWKSRSFERSEKPDVAVKTKTPLMPTKPSPPPASVKPSSFKGNPPPLPSKPKPSSALRPESNIFRGARARPMSEFIDPKHVPSSVQQRAASWGKKKSEDSKESDKK